MGGGVSFVDGGERDLIGSSEKPTPAEPSGRGESGLKFVDGGSGDETNIAYGTDKQGNLDESSHDTTSGPGIKFVDDL
jgi:hypothetical protein